MAWLSTAVCGERAALRTLNTDRGAILENVEHAEYTIHSPGHLDQLLNRFPLPFITYSKFEYPSWIVK